MDKDTKPAVTRDSDKFMLRFPDGMRDKIAELAKANNRSMNAEIIARLQNSEQAHSPDLAFLLARMEMRAAEAELDNIELKAMLSEAAWCLKAALLSFAPDELASSEKLRERVAEWSESVVAAMRYAGEFAEPDTDTLRLGEQKANELSDATRRAQEALNELRKKRNELAHSMTLPKRIMRPSKKP